MVKKKRKTELPPDDECIYSGFPTVVLSSTREEGKFTVLLLQKKKLRLSQARLLSLLLKHNIVLAPSRLRSKHVGSVRNSKRC